MNIATNENENHRNRDTATDRDLKKDQKRTSPLLLTIVLGSTVDLDGV